MGDSMAPTFTPGQLIFGVRPRKIRPGDIVVIHHDGLDKIKRVKDIKESKIFLTGDNSLQSTDSREFGWLDIGTVIARVTWPTST